MPRAESAAEPPPETTTLRTAQTITMCEADPEDTLRFYALRLHESGLIKSSPKKLIAQGTD
jgi:hypothetical protein